jgi:hypothetical protein
MRIRFAQVSQGLRVSAKVVPGHAAPMEEDAQRLRIASLSWLRIG